MKKSHPTQSLVSLVLMALLAACAAPAAPQTVPQPPAPTEAPSAPTEAPKPTDPPKAKVIRLAVGDMGDGNLVITLDPQLTGYSNEQSVANLMYEGLTRPDSALNMQPGVAESWASNADQTEWTFTLRKDAKYDDGSLLNAKRFEYALMRTLNPASGADASSYMAIAGAGEWAGAFGAAAEEKDEAKKKALEEDAKKAEATVRESVQALDASGQPCTGYDQADCLTLRVKLNTTQAYFPLLMTSPSIAPIKEEVLSKGPDWWKDAANHIGNGTHKIKSLDAKSIYVVPNTNYWRGLAKTDIQVTAIPKPGYVEAFKKGEADMVSLVDFVAADYAELRKDAALAQQLQSAPTACTFILPLRTNQKPFDDVKVRQAFAAALDRTRIIKEDLGDESVPALTWVPPGVRGFNADEKRFAYDPEAARKLLAESSYKTVEALPPMTFLFNADQPQAIDSVNKYIAMWREVFPGLKLEAKGLATDEYRAMRGDPASAFHMSWTSWCLGFGESTTFLADYFSNGGRGNMLTVWSSAQFDEIAAQAAKEPDADKRAALNQQAESIVIEEQPQITIAYFANVVLIKPTLKVGPTSPNDLFRGDMDRLLWDVE